MHCMWEKSESERFAYCEKTYIKTKGSQRIF